MKNIIQLSDRKLFNNMFPWDRNLINEKAILNNLKDNLGMKHMSKIAILWWCIWYFINQIIFNKAKYEVKQVVEFINRQNNN